ncbi:hypothetical protein [Neobacillus kokaensis]|uniref:Uncharacterized protein n=1 Tax=Neobacillus kokaensis TaxID=2759023 RepID=A0ABQ3NA75_9BACI|nr:hypothetical protein [Neobacillus kokaensis]GHH99910.1 hypothetical protein AM1BK_34530 [Neobacillus kokaensis]
MKNNLELLEGLLLNDDGLLKSLRMGDGLDKEKANQVYKVLADLAAEWKGQEKIHKKAVDLFIDVYPAMLSSSDYYSDKVANEIMDCCDKIIDLIRDCLSY